MQISQRIAVELLRVETWVPWIFRGLRVLMILGVAWLLTHIARRLLRRLGAYAARSMARRGTSTDLELEKRATTIMTVLAKLASFVIWLVALTMALNEMTFNVQPLLASLGVAGLALGLGAQALIKDWLGGLLILLEDQIRIGDAVTINGISGVVEEINLRTTVLRSENGALHVIANGLIVTISNMTREYACYVFEATLAHGTDVDRALKIKINELDSDAIGKLLGQADLVEEWIKDLRELAFTMLENDKPVAGYKLVPKRATRDRKSTRLNSSHT